MVKVNYYVSDLYGNPEKVPDVWSSPLAVFVKEGSAKTWKHPAVKKVLQLKWETFGLRMFVISEVGFGFVLLLFMLAHINRDETTACTHREYVMTTVLTVVSALMIAYQACLIMSQIWLQKVVKVKLFGRLPVSIPRYLTHFWSCLRMAAVILMFSLFFIDACGMGKPSLPPMRRIGGGKIVELRAALKAMVALIMWIQITQATIISTRMSSFTYIIGIMVDDLTNTFIMIAILLASFASALSIIHDAPFVTFQDAILVLTEEILGIPTPSYEQTSWLSMMLIIAFVICVVVGLINILVAQLTITYKGLTKDKEAFALKHRASVCLDIEDLLPMWYRRPPPESGGGGGLRLAARITRHSPLQVPQKSLPRPRIRHPAPLWKRRRELLPRPPHCPATLVCMLFSSPFARKCGRGPSRPTRTRCVPPEDTDPIPRVFLARRLALLAASRSPNLTAATAMSRTASCASLAIRGRTTRGLRSRSECRMAHLSA